MGWRGEGVEVDELWGQGVVPAASWYVVKNHLGQVSLRTALNCLRTLTTAPLRAGWTDLLEPRKPGLVWARQAGLGSHP